MKQISLIFSLLLLSLIVNAQKVCSVQYSSRADVKVYVAEYESRADLLVYKVNY